jgi:hypothetical protein
MISAARHFANVEEDCVSVPYLREAAAEDDVGKLVRFVSLHLGDGNETVGKKSTGRGPKR